MLGVTADGVFFIHRGWDNNADGAYGRLQIVQKLSDARQHFRRRIFIRRGNDNNADDKLWTIFQILGTWSPH